MKTIKIGLLGLGNIGTGTYKTLEMNRSEIESTLNAKVEIVKILERDTERDRGITVPKEKFTSDPDEIFQDPEIDIVIELLGGIEPATTFMLSALKNGKHVVTANKAALAANYHELINAAKENNVILRFEASVGGGIPILGTLTGPLRANKFEEVMGILNGTTNYMLDKMITEGADFNTVLKEAQEKGYAEADPTADVEGQDACRKIAILSSLAYGKFLNFENVYTEGITKITPEDMEYAREMGRSIKLLGTSKKLGDDSFYALVAPFLVGQENPLYGVKGVFNSIFVHGNMLGDAMFYGSGAGKLPTASAVVADVVEAAKHLHDTIPNNWSNEEMTLMEPDSVEGRFFVRVKDTSLDEVDKAFGKVEAVIEPDSLPEEFGFITRLMTQGEYKERVKALGENVLGMIRVKD